MYFLAMCYSDLGHAKKAKEYFDRATAGHQQEATSQTKEEAEELRHFRSEAQTLLAEKRRQ